MTFDEIIEGIRTLPDAEFHRLSDEMFVMRRERDARPQVEQAQAELITELQESGKLDRPRAYTLEQAIADPEGTPAWVNPLADHAEMYHAGDVITHAERFWPSKHANLNSWEPGAHGVDEQIWRDVTDLVRPVEKPSEDTEGGVRAFAPGIDVQEGDVLEYEGQRYRVLSAHTTASHWPPDQAHALFQPL